MPGNESTPKSNKAFIPVIWKEVNVTADQASTQVAIASFPAAIKRFALPRQTSVVTMTVQLSAALTAGWLDFEITQGGVGSGKKIRMNSAAGTVKRLDIVPGEIVGAAGARLGVEWSSGAAMAPSGSVDAVVFFEVQDA